MSFSSPRLRLGLLALALTAGVPATVAATAPAGAAARQAASVATITKTDRVGDVGYRGGSSVDITSAVVTQDRTNGIFTAQVTFDGDPALAPTAWIWAGLGFSYGTDTCYISDDAPGVAHLKANFGTPDARWSISAPTDISGPATKVVAGNTMTLTSQASPLFKSPFVCMAIGTFASDDEGKQSKNLHDSIVAGFPVEVPTATPVAPPATGDGKPQVALDRDLDAVPDSTDKCIDVPGAGTDGCPTTPPAKSLNLGTKRLVVDRLLRRTGSACPAVVKATVVAKGRTLGKQKLGVIAKGSWCHATGVVKLKKRAKKVRVVIAGTGVASVKQVVSKG